MREGWCHVRSEAQPRLPLSAMTRPLSRGRGVAGSRVSFSPTSGAQFLVWLRLGREEHGARRAGQPAVFVDGASIVSRCR